MHKFYFHRLGLCEEAGESAGPTSGGTTPPPPATPPAEAAAAKTAVEPPAVTAAKAGVEPPAVAASKAGVVDRAVALFKDKGALGAEIATLKSEVSRVKIERDGLKAQLAAITTDRDGLKAEFTRLETALAAANAEKTTVQTEVAHQLAAQGVPEAQLPKAGGSATAQGNLDEQIADLNERAAASDDPLEKGRLAKQAWDLMVKRGSHGLS